MCSIWSSFPLFSTLFWENDLNPKLFFRNSAYSGTTRVPPTVGHRLVLKSLSWKACRVCEELTSGHPDDWSYFHSVFFSSVQVYSTQQERTFTWFFCLQLLVAPPFSVSISLHKGLCWQACSWSRRWRSHANVLHGHVPDVEANVVAGDGLGQGLVVHLDGLDLSICILSSPGLSVLGDTSLKLSSSWANDKDTTVSLAGSGDHALDEFTVAGGVNDGDIVLGGLKLPESNVNSDSTLTLRLQLVHDPSILEEALQNSKH